MSLKSSDEAAMPPPVSSTVWFRRHIGSDFEGDAVPVAVVSSGSLTLREILEALRSKYPTFGAYDSTEMYLFPFGCFDPNNKQMSHLDQDEDYDLKRHGGEMKSNPIVVSVVVAVRTALAQSLARENEANARANEANARENEANARANEANARENEANARANEAKASLAETKELATSANEFCAECRFIPDSTTSDACLHRDLRVATINWINDVKLIDPPDKFWKACVFPVVDCAEFGSENETQNGVLSMLKGVIGALKKADLIPKGCEVRCRLQRNLVDAIPDISLCMGNNQYLIGTVDVKKHVERNLNDIFDSDTPGAGQLYIQLALCQLGLVGNCYAMLSTYNKLIVVSTGRPQDDLSKINVRISKLTEATQADEDDSPNRDRLPLALAAQMKPARQRKQPPANATEKVMKPIPTEKSLSYEMYCIAKAALATSGTTRTIEMNNKEYIKALATFVLLCVQSMENGPRKIHDVVPLSGQTRTFHFGTVADTNQLTMKFTTYKAGIDYNSFPNKSDNTFHVWSQLGIGATGTCCFASVPQDIHARTTGAPCVLKIFHCSDDMLERAEKEASNWKKVYSDEKWDFITVHKAFRSRLVVLVLPFFHVPSDTAERLSLLGDAAEKEQSLLWKALETFAKSGYKHLDLKWHHVGILRRKKGGRKRPRTGNPTDDRVFLLDLGDVGELAENDRTAWITESYDKLRSRAGLAPV